MNGVLQGSAVYFQPMREWEGMTSTVNTHYITVQFSWPDTEADNTRHADQPHLLGEVPKLHGAGGRSHQERGRCEEHGHLLQNKRRWYHIICHLLIRPQFFCSSPRLPSQHKSPGSLPRLYTCILAASPPSLRAADWLLFAYQDNARRTPDG